MSEPETVTVASKQNPHRDYRGLDRTKLTPMSQHYTEIKDQYPNAILLYRVGDFFECFFQDAVTVSRELELILTSKDGGKEIGRIAMTGVPHHALDRYARQLVEKGYSIAVCDQVEDAAMAAAEGRMVERQITRLITPGTLTQNEMLVARKNNFLASVVIAENNWGLAYADISTGEFFTTQLNDLKALELELLRLQPSEILFPTNAPDINTILRPGDTSNELPSCLPSCFCYSLRAQKHFHIHEAKNRLLESFRVKSLEGMGCEQLPLAIRASGALLQYVEDTQRMSFPLQPLKTYNLADYLILDHTTRRNLEITTTIRDNASYGSLLWALDKTETAMGGRALRRWLLQPLLEIKGIKARQDTIEELKNKTHLREDLKNCLSRVYDLERLITRVVANSANGKELLNLGESLLRLKDLAEVALQGESPYLKTLQKVPEELETIGLKIVTSLVESPPLHTQEGGLIRDGVNEDLDYRRKLMTEDNNWLRDLEINERERTGISTLKIGYNKTFGYYISLPRSKSDKAPENYDRKQTLTNEERYITTELKERETRILTAQDDLNRLEYEIFCELRLEMASKATEIRTVAKAVAAVDVLAGLAELAVYQGYCKPEMTTDRTLEIIDGRHPVVEQSIGSGCFVPNSSFLGKTNQNNTPDLIILTGPNASGKSCYLRQIGLIQLLAQTGSFVPAKKAKLGICDRIFTRVGAMDDLTTGQSTFMVEMNETANILNHATPKSLVLLDEIGRGTATFDGLSIAWAVAEYLATEIQSRTIFATHYHELNELASILDNVANYQVTVQEMPDEIIFLHQVRGGGADKSYGIEAGRLAGLPSVVIQRAKQVMGQIEKHSKIALGLRKGVMKQHPSKDEFDPQLKVSQLDIFE